MERLLALPVVWVRGREGRKEREGREEREEGEREVRREGGSESRERMMRERERVK